MKFVLWGLGLAALLTSGGWAVSHIVRARESLVQESVLPPAVARSVSGGLARLRPGMTRAQVWRGLGLTGRLPHETASNGVSEKEGWLVSDKSLVVLSYRPERQFGGNPPAARLIRVQVLPWRG